VVFWRVDEVIAGWGHPCGLTPHLMVVFKLRAPLSWVSVRGCRRPSTESGTCVSRRNSWTRTGRVLREMVCMGETGGREMVTSPVRVESVVAPVHPDSCPDDLLAVEEEAERLGVRCAWVFPAPGEVVAVITGDRKAMREALESLVLQAAFAQAATAEA
jgi:hypothetical protein